ncbi:MAG: hypothetical protein JWP29_1284 [Rhodoferax sp.]|nr:hypothetical protein [Rhodoferax sp.]
MQLDHLDLYRIHRVKPDAVQVRCGGWMPFSIITGNYQN